MRGISIIEAAGTGSPRFPRLASAIAPSACLLALTITILLLAPGAGAAEPQKIAGYGTGAGKVNGAHGVAVDEAHGPHGYLYVADQGNNRIDKFDTEGHFLMAWGFGVRDTALELETCGPEAEPETVKCFGLTGSAIGNNNAPGNVGPEAVAVDSAGDVYVADRNKLRITKFTPIGEFLWMAGRNVNASGATQEEKNICTAADVAEGDECGAGQNGAGAGEFFTSPRAIAIDPSDHLWVLDGNSTSRIVQLDSSGHYTAETLIASTRRQGLVRDSVGDFYTIRPGVNERQNVSFGGFAVSDTYRLGNLPASCSSSSTAPIIYYGYGFQDQEAIQSALDEKCPTDFDVFNTVVRFVNELVDQDFGQLSCTKLTGGGSCSVNTTQQGAVGTVDKLDSTGVLLETIYSGAPEALVIDSEDNLYVGDGRNYHFRRFNPAGEQTSQFGAGQVIGSPQGNALALDESTGALFAASSESTGLGAPPTPEGEAEVAVQRFALPPEGPLVEGLRAEEVLPTTATLQADLNPEDHKTTYRFQYGVGSSFDHETEEETLPAEEGYEGEAVVPAPLTHLIPGTEYRYRLVATNANGTVEEEKSFTTRPAVGIEAQWATAVSATDATLHAQLNPLGPAGRWWIEYGAPGEGLGSETPHEPLGGGFAETEVSRAIAGLSPATTYSYRFAAEDEREVEEGGEIVNRAFVVRGPTQSFRSGVTALGFELPDERAWEQVTPLHKGLGLIGGYNATITQAAADGAALTYTTLGPISDEGEGNRTVDPLQSLARRGAGGWSSEEINPPEETAAPAVLGSEFRIFSTDLCRSAVEPFGQRAKRPTLLSAWASERTPYLRENCGASPTWTPLAVGCPVAGEPCPAQVAEHANVPAGTEFGGEEEQQLHASRGPVRANNGASPDLSHIVVRSKVALSEDAEGVAEALYEWSLEDGSVALVSRLPNGKAAKGTLGWTPVHTGVRRDAVSADGRYVYWSNEANPTALYVRDTATEETLRLDTLQPGAAGGGKDAPVFQGASADGTRAFFTDTRELTKDSGASKEKPDLFACEIVRAEGEDRCELSDLTPEAAGSEAADVQGVVSAIDEAGEDVYFVANGALAPEAEGGQPNLYLARLEGGKWDTRFIATLSSLDAPDWGLLAGQPQPEASEAKLASSASPDGRYLAFMSRLPLTGYDNRDAAGGEAAEEVFRYDAQADELRCVSCNPAGGRPRGALAVELRTANFLWGNGRLAALLTPQSWSQGSFEGPIYQPRRVLDDGRVFFNAFDSLVPADSNGTSDAYQYESHGVGDCTPSSGGAATAQALEGGACVSLLSSGTSETESSVLDASASGEDVFIYTASPLSALDEDPDYDIYDARVGGVAARREAHPECLGEACQPAAQSPNDPTPASAAFEGPGNVREGAAPRRCPKGKRRVRRHGKVRCLARQAKRQRDHRRHKAHHVNRRSHR